jgi:hypothetical protein
MRRNWIAIAAALALLWGIDFVVSEPEDRSAFRRAASEAELLRARYAERRPELVVLGDSMVGEGIDEEALGHRLGVRASNVWRGGAGSAWCYLALENLILASEIPPQWVVVVYRDHFLTEPRFRVDGPYRPHLAALSGRREALLEELALEPTDPAVALLRRVPLYSQRERIRTGLQSGVMDGVGAALFHLEPGAVAKVLARVFDDAALDPEQFGERQLEAERVADDFAFDRDVEASFLPAMVELAAAQQVRLAFVRMKRRRDLEPDREPAGLQRYQHELVAWLAERQIPVIDFTHDDRVRAEHYAVGDHLSRGEGRNVFTVLLADALRPILGPNLPASVEARAGI